METIQFKTNINCQGCLAKVSPALNQLLGIGNWRIDLLDEKKVLSVKTLNVKPDLVIEKIKERGFTAEII